VVRAPATVANLGPGFDCLGVAIEWHNQITVERAPSLELTATGVGAERIPRDDSNLVVRAIEQILGHTNVRVNELCAIPDARGFGSSAAAIVSGLIAARALEDLDIPDIELLRVAVDMEGHADNVAPCMFGGLAVAAEDRALRLQLSEKLRPLVFVAPNRFSTAAARDALPDSLKRTDAVENAARAALLAVALHEGAPNDVLMAATEDVVHQPARFALMPDTAELVHSLREAGIAAFLSGAGPSVCAIVSAKRAPDAEQMGRALAPDGWEVRAERFDMHGADVVEKR
jgi:homoserine kinase